MSALVVLYANEVEQEVRELNQVPKTFRKKVEEELKRREQEKESAES